MLKSFCLKTLSCLFLLPLAVSISAYAAPTCNPNVEIISVAVDSNTRKVSVTVRNNGASTATAQVLTYKRYSTVDIDSTPNDNSGVATLQNGQSALISTYYTTCASVVRLKVNNSCTTDIQSFDGSGYCQRCSQNCMPTPTCTPVATKTPTPTPQPPVCNAGGPYTGSTITCSTTPIQVQLDGSKSTGVGLTYEWNSNCPSSSFNSTTVVSPILSLITAPASASDPAVSCKVSLKVKSSQGTSSICSSDLTSQPCVRDCAGVINGTAKVDRCGVCNGNGDSCLGCNSVNIQDEQLALDNNANSLRDNVLKVNKQLQVGSKNAGISQSAVDANANYITNSNAAAQSLYKQVWTSTYTSFPPVIVSCTATFCVNTSTTSSKVNISGDNKDLVDLAKASQKKLDGLVRTAKRNKAKNLNKVIQAAAKSRQIVNQSIALNTNSNGQLLQIPGTQSSCS